jgi:transcriptional regulator with XRE-family HTH domain
MVKIIDRGRLGDLLVTLRQGRSLTQADLEAETGISRAHIAKIETGRDGVSLQSLVALADFLGVSLDEMYGRPRPSSGAPDPDQLVKDGDEFALLQFWRNLDESQRRLFLRLIGSAREVDDVA